MSGQQKETGYTEFSSLGPLEGTNREPETLNGKGVPEIEKKNPIAGVQ
jgi:hypothetical protein